MMSANPSARILARGVVDERVCVMLEITARRSPDVLERLRANAIGEIRTWKDVALIAIKAEQVDPDCEIAGVYTDTISPPRIGIVESASRRRAAFTALHEFGHHLQRTEDALVDQLVEQPDDGRYLEELSSNSFAAAVLLPPGRVRSELGTSTPTALQVAALWKANAASRAAVCVAAARQLDRPGHVILLNADGTVEFSTTHNEFPLRRGSDQSKSAIFRAAENSSMSAVTAKTRFRYQDRYDGAELYAQATALDGYLLIVAVTDGAPWETLALSSREPSVLGGWHTCINCGNGFNSWDPPCEVCKAVRCPECGRCECPNRVEERVCEECFMIKPSHQFVGSSRVCVDH